MRQRRARRQRWRWRWRRSCVRDRGRARGLGFLDDAPETLELDQDRGQREQDEASAGEHDPCERERRAALGADRVNAIGRKGSAPDDRHNAEAIEDEDHEVPGKVRTKSGRRP